MAHHWQSPGPSANRADARHRASSLTGPEHHQGATAVPTYEYACTNPEGKHQFEVVQSFSDAPVTECPECGAPVRKVYGSVGVVFKGSGFYRTDSRKSASASDGASGSKESSSSSSSSKESSTSSTTSSSPAASAASTSGGGSKAAS
jgi:putative FmdB family regulatory protein